MPGKKRFDYTDLALTSIKHMRKNPALFLPDFVLFLITFFITIIFYRYSGLSILLSEILTAEARTELIKLFLFENWLQVLVSVLIFAFVTFVLGVSIETIKFTMIKQIILKKKISLLKSWQDKNNYFWKIVLMKVMIFLLVLIAIFLLSIFSIILFTISSTFGGFSLTWLISILALIVFIFFTLSLLFRYAILFLENKSAGKTIRKSFMFFKKNKKHTFNVWFITTLVGVVFGVLATTMSIYLAKLQVLTNVIIIIYIISFMSSFASFAIRILSTIWSQLFIFENYK